MLRRIAVVFAFPFAILYWTLRLPIEYVRTGTVDPNNTPMDKLARWAK